MIVGTAFYQLIKAIKILNRLSERRNMRLALPSLAIILAMCLIMVKPVAGDCECGYSVNSTSDPDFAIFTEILESDFTKLKDIHHDIDWIVQEWQIDKQASQGPYGRQVDPSNCVSNPQGKNGGEAGLELWVRALVNSSQDVVSVAEVDSHRTDMLYGTFRAGIKHTGVNGTCGAFFWYLNDTQEIDMEFLSSQLNGTTSRVNLVLHSTESLLYGNDASNTPGFQVIQLPFNSVSGVHEYRFDWQSDKVTFYADGQWLFEIADKSYIPSSAGKIVLSHWSNGNPLWSGGPPAVDAKMLVTYVKAYFNTTDENRLQGYAKRCTNLGAPNAICAIPQQIGSPEENQPYFFTEDPSNNKTPGTTTQGEIEAGKKSSASSILRNALDWSLTIVLFVGFLLIWE